MWSNSFQRLWTRCSNMGSAFRARLHTMSSTNSSSSGFAFSRWLNRYCALLESHPFATQITTSSVLGFAGDFTTQWFEHRWEEADRIKLVAEKKAKGETLSDEDLTETPRVWNYRRAFSCGLFGTLFMGPIGHVWYNWLDKVCYRLFPLATAASAVGRDKWKMIFFKSAADTLTFGPITLLCFFAFVSSLEGVPSPEIKAKLKRDFVPTYLIDYSIWPIVQCINFRFIPLRHQLLFVNLNCYFDDIFLSFIQHNGMPSIFKGLEQRYENWVKLSPQELKLADRAARRARGKPVEQQDEIEMENENEKEEEKQQIVNNAMRSITQTDLSIHVLNDSTARRTSPSTPFSSSSPPTVTVANTGAKSQ